MNYKQHKAIMAKRPIEEIAYEIEHCYNNGYSNTTYKRMVDSLFNWYDKKQSWTVKQEEFLRNHLAYIKTERDYDIKIKSC